MFTSRLISPPTRNSMAGTLSTAESDDLVDVVTWCERPFHKTVDGWWKIHRPNWKLAVRWTDWNSRFVAYRVKSDSISINWLKLPSAVTSVRIQTAFAGCCLVKRIRFAAHSIEERGQSTLEQFRNESDWIRPRYPPSKSEKNNAVDQQFQSHFRFSPLAAELWALKCRNNFHSIAEMISNRLLCKLSSLKTFFAWQNSDETQSKELFVENSGRITWSRLAHLFFRIQQILSNHVAW